MCLLWTYYISIISYHELLSLQAFCSKHSDVKDDVQKKLSASPDEEKDESMTDEERKELRSHRQLLVFNVLLQIAKMNVPCCTRKI